jgi:cytosine/uracil/thiamine/allantoin permease
LAEIFWLTCFSFWVMTIVPNNDNSNLVVIGFNFYVIFPKKLRFKNDSLVYYYQ